MGATLALTYAFAVLVASWMSPDLGFTHLQGSRILSVRAGGPAEAAGLQRGDVIAAVNGVATLDAVTRAHVLWQIDPASNLELRVVRAGVERTISYPVARRVPFESASGVMLATFLLVLALLADRGGGRGHVRNFFFSSLVYVVFTSGIFAFDAIGARMLLSVPWLVSVVLAGPVTCHHMIKFPAGPQRLDRRILAWLYGPPLLLALLVIVNQVAFSLGKPLPHHEDVAVLSGVLMGVCAAIYLGAGGRARFHRMRKKRDEIDRIARRWLHLGGFFMAGPLIVGVVYAVFYPVEFVPGGFPPAGGDRAWSGAARHRGAWRITPLALWPNSNRSWRPFRGFILGHRMGGRPSIWE